MATPCPVYRCRSRAEHDKLFIDLYGIGCHRMGAVGVERGRENVLPNVHSHYDLWVRLGDRAIMYVSQSNNGAIPFEDERTTHVNSPRHMLMYVKRHGGPRG